VRRLLLKLEALQVTGSFKPRGAVNALLALRIVLVEDAEMRAAARWLWNEMGIAAELSGAAAVAAVLTGHYRPAPEERICAIVCGARTDGISSEAPC
jgi:threonine dehydratase